MNIKFRIFVHTLTVHYVRPQPSANFGNFWSESFLTFYPDCSNLSVHANMFILFKNMLIIRFQSNYGCWNVDRTFSQCFHNVAYHSVIFHDWRRFYQTDGTPIKMFLFLKTLCIWYIISALINKSIRGYNDKLLLIPKPKLHETA